jgi:hypothetical protein
VNTVDGLTELVHKPPYAYIITGYVLGNSTHLLSQPVVDRLTYSLFNSITGLASKTVTTGEPIQPTNMTKLTLRASYYYYYY